MPRCHVSKPKLGSHEGAENGVFRCFFFPKLLFYILSYFFDCFIF